MGKHRGASAGPTGWDKPPLRSSVKMNFTFLLPTRFGHLPGQRQGTARWAHGGPVFRVKTDWWSQNGGVKGGPGGVDKTHVRFSAEAAERRANGGVGLDK